MNDMKELVCIVCPKGCRLQVDEQNDYCVTGNACPRGEAYGRKELINPTRVVTSTVRIEGARYRRLPVKTNAEIPKQSMMDAMKILDGITLHAPVKAGDVVAANILGLGIDFIATRDMERV